MNIETEPVPVSFQPRQISRRRTEDGRVPPLWHLRVPRHQAGVNIWLLAHGAPRLHPDLLAEVEEGMHEGGGDRCKRESVGQREGCRKEKWAVCLVLRNIQRRVHVNDPRHIVRLAEAVE